MAAVTQLPRNPLQRDIGQMDANAALRRQTQLALMNNIIGTMKDRQDRDVAYQRQRELIAMENDAALAREQLRGELDIERSRVMTDAAFKRQEELDRKREVREYVKKGSARRPDESEEEYLARAYEEDSIRQDQRAMELADQRYQAQSDAQSAREEMARIVQEDKAQRDALLKADLDQVALNEIKRYVKPEPGWSAVQLLEEMQRRDPKNYENVRRAIDRKREQLDAKYLEPSLETQTKLNALSRRAMQADKLEQEAASEFSRTPGAQRAYRELLTPEAAPEAAPDAPLGLLDPDTGAVVVPRAIPQMPDAEAMIREDAALAGLVATAAQPRMVPDQGAALREQLAELQAVPMGAIPQAARALPEVMPALPPMREYQALKDWWGSWQPERQQAMDWLWRGRGVPVSPQGTPMPAMPELTVPPPAPEVWPGNDNLIRVPLARPRGMF